MPSIVPVRLLPGVYITEIFPVTTSIANGPSFVSTLIGPVRTVVRAEQGILGGPVFNTMPPYLSESVSRWGFIVKFTGTETVAVNFAGTVISITTNNVDVFVAQLRTRLLAANFTLGVIRDFYTSVPTDPTARHVKILASQGAIDSGFFPSIQFTFGVNATITTEAAAPVLTGDYLLFTSETSTSHAVPALPSNWSSILNRRVMEEIIYGLDATRRGLPFSEPERFYFDVTDRMTTALDQYLGLSANAKSFYGDFTFVADASAIALAAAIIISKVPLGGTQRVTAISISTGVEYELRNGYDYTITPAAVAGAYQYGDSLTWIPGGPSWAAFGTSSILVRAVYTPDRYVMPLPVLNYGALTPRGISVLEPTPIDKFVFLPAGGGSVVVDHIDPPQAARITYSGVYNIAKTAGIGNTLVNIAPRLSKTVSLNATSPVNISFSADGFGTPNIDPLSIVVIRADGTILTVTTDYTYVAATNIFTFIAAGPNQPTAVASNPLSIRYIYQPQVTFVGNPTITISVAPTSIGYTPVFTNLGGGLFVANTLGTVTNIAVPPYMGGTGYTSPPTVSFSGPGTLYGVDVIDGGSLYVHGEPVTFAGGAGTGAAGWVEVNGSGAVQRVWMTNFGTGYLPADVVTPTIVTGAGIGANLTLAIVDTSGGTGAAAIATVTAGVVTSIRLTNNGHSYGSGVAVALSGGGGDGFARAICSVGPVGNGGVSSVTFDTGNIIVSSLPILVLTGGGGSGARVFPFVHIAFDSRIIGTFVQDPGTGYSTPPTVTAVRYDVVGTFDVDGQPLTAVLVPGGVVAVAAVTATIEYPVQPELRLEFMADRSDLDGDLFFVSTNTELAAEPQLKDIYAGQTIETDTTVANPTVHATAITLAISPGVPAILGVGTYTAARIAPVLDALKAQPNAYWLVAITQDSDAALLYLGAHIDTMVATIAGTQVHYAPGGFRVMETTLDQRNEVQYVPLAKDTTFGTGHLVNALSGGIAVQIDLIGATGSVIDIQPGDFCEFYQTDPTGAAIYGTTSFAKPLAKRLQITDVNISTLSASEFTVSDASLPINLDPNGPGDTTFVFKYGAPVRFVKVRQDLELGAELGAYVASIGNQPNGRRRWIRQPDIIVIADLDSFQRVVPGYYLCIIEAAARSANLPHQGFTNFPLPVVTNVHRGDTFYASSDTINLMTDGGIQYAVKKSANQPVAFVQQLTSDRDNQLTQSPTVTQIVDFAGRLIKQNLDPYIGVTNLVPSVIDAIATVVESSIEQMKQVQSNQLGPMVISGQLTKMTRLPATSTNAGLAITIQLFVAQDIGQINVTFLVDIPQAT